MVFSNKANTHPPKSWKQLRKQFVQQQDAADCGPICLLNILKYHGASVPTERLRELSGTSRQGATLLGLCHAARAIGLEAEGAEATSVNNLAEVEHPCLLHLTIEGRTLHYVVYYPHLSKPEGLAQEFVIGDPAKGLVTYSAAELDRVWGSKACLLLTPTPALQAHQQTNNGRWKWLWSVVRQDVQLLYLAAFVGIVLAALNLTTAFFSQQLIDKIIPAQDRNKLMAGAALMFFLLLIKAGAGYLRQLLLIKQSTQFSGRLANRFFTSLLHLPKPFFDNRKTGDLVARLNDTGRIQQATSQLFGEVSIQVLLLLVSSLFIFVFSWAIGLLCLLLIGCIFGVVRYHRKAIAERQRAMLAAYSRSEANYIDTIHGIGSVKALGRETFFGRMAQNIFSLFQSGILALGKTKGRFNAHIECLTALFTTGLIVWGTLLVFGGQIKTGELIAILQMAGLLAQAALSIAIAHIQLQEAKVAFDRMYEFAALEPEYDEALRDTTPTPPPFESLEVKDLCFRFPGRPLLLRQVGFSLNKGQLVAIAGESGKGKSTLLKLLQRFYAMESGAIVLNGQPAQNIDTPAWRRLLGVVQQGSDIFSGSLAENLLLARQAATVDELIAFCKQYGFDPFFAALPQGYGTIIGEGGVELSGGQKQLLCLARALFAEPQLLLLDEPTAAMDSQTEKFVVQLLQRLKKQVGILVISHRDSLTKIADKVYVLEHDTLCPQHTAVTGPQAVLLHAVVDDR
jgi:ATP-binding cassette, subfamily C, bacteriocin exporter